MVRLLELVHSGTVSYGESRQGRSLGRVEFAISAMTFSPCGRQERRGVAVVWRANYKARMVRLNYFSLYHKW